MSKASRTFGVITSYSAIAGYGTWMRYFDFTEDLDDGETLTGTPEVTTNYGGVTLSNKAVNSSAITTDDRTIAIGKAAQFRVTTTATKNGAASIYCSVATTDGNRKTAIARQPICEVDGFE